ncbi:MAG TPA: glucose-6-phosphate isomerase [Verrucomicrobiae bacterium]|nr:glucose-6-phosphate isomerase [Verrucomicrobiae bacterium]
MSEEQLWERFQKFYFEFPSAGLAIDLSRTELDLDYIQKMSPALQSAFAAMDQLEAGAIANPDEKRMVGHYWLRNPALAPNPEIRRAIEQTLSAVKSFAHQVHSGAVQGQRGTLKKLLVVGIGGSALGPEFVAHALGHPGSDPMSVFFFDNTDPDGMDKVLAAIGSDLGRTLTIVISKSGGTKETRNGMVEAERAYQNAGLDFARHAVAITGTGSELDKTAEKAGWVQRFPMWDWVGGRSSETSAVGLLPAALQGFDIDRLLAGAAACDQLTRRHSFPENPSAQLAVAWHAIGQGKGAKDMVILPYKDRLELFSRYLQQLIMESLGKELDLSGKVVNQGIAVYGNKGSTDQHAYIQQLREGLNNFFATFIQVLKDRERKSMQVEPGFTSGDYLHGFYLGTRQALWEKDRQSITITIDQVDAFHVGVLIALYERAVGLYAALVKINAYHQPGVEAGKKAATAILQLQAGVVNYLTENSSRAFGATEIAQGIGQKASTESIFKICQHLAANQQLGADGRNGINTKFRAHR